jgi:hypothetical protein
LASPKETVVYLHTDGFGNEVRAGESLLLRDLEMADGTCAIRLLHPHTGQTARTTGYVKSGRLSIVLPTFFEDIAVHILPD